MSSAQVPEGYKQTEVGVVPEDWEVVVLGDLTEKVGSGITPTGGARVYKDYGRPFVRSQNVGWGILKLDDLAYIDEEIHQSFVGSEIREKDVLLNITGASIGRSSIAGIKVIGGNVNQHVCIIRVNQKRLSSRFLNLLLLSEDGQKQIDSFQAGGNREGLNFAQIRSFKIRKPREVKEQRLIAQALSDVDALIASLHKLIAKQRQLKTAAMQQLLTGKMRLPGFGEGKGYKQTEIGAIPEDWDIRFLREVGQILIGLTYRPEDTRDYGTLVLRSSNVQNDRLAYENNVYVDSSLPLPPRVIVEKGDILICVRNGSKQLIGKCALIDNGAAGSAFGAFMSVFRTKFSGYILYQFQSDIIQTQINEIMGATINQITNKDMAAFQVPLPSSNKEQRAIAIVLSNIDDAITALETRRAKTQAIKQGMMQELLTGKTRLV